MGDEAVLIKGQKKKPANWTATRAALDIHLSDLLIVTVYYTLVGEILSTDFYYGSLRKLGAK